MPITKGFQALVDEAMAQVTTYSVAEVSARLSDPQVQIVDIRAVSYTHLTLPTKRIV